MQDLDDLDAELRDMIADMPTSCEWKGMTFDAAKAELGGTVDVSPFAFEGKLALIVSVPLRVFTGGNIPAIQDRFLVAGERYEIGTVDKSRDGLVLRLGLVQDDRRVP
jgi:hypothetical protein